MNLRFIEREGKKILQQQSAKQWSNKDADIIWEDVPLIQEPRQAREWNLYSAENENGLRAIPVDSPLIRYYESQALQFICKVREVIE